MVLILDDTHNMVRTHEGRWIFSEKKSDILIYYSLDQMPSTDLITKIAPCVRIQF